MKLFVPAILMTVEAQFGDYDSADYSLDGASYSYEAFTGPASDEERRRPNKVEFEEIEESAYSFDEYEEYGFTDYSDLNAVEGGFSDYESSEERPAAASAGKEFAAPTFGGQNDADDGTPATRSCLTCLITDLANFGSCAPQECTPSATVGEAEEDTRDYCLIEIRQTNGGFDQLEMRCAQAHDCISGFLANVQGADPKRTDQCRPAKDDSGVATEHWSGRWGSRQSVCRNCAVMGDGTNAAGAYKMQVDASSITMFDKTGAAVADGSASTNMLEWSREMWHGAANFGFLKQD